VSSGAARGLEAAPEDADVWKTPAPVPHPHVTPLRYSLAGYLGDSSHRCCKEQAACPV